MKCTEVNLKVLEWMKEIATSISKAFVLTIDYGYSSGELYSQNRRNGTLVCYNIIKKREILITKKIGYSKNICELSNSGNQIG